MESVDVFGTLPERAGAAGAVGPKRQEALFAHTVLAVDVAVLVVTFFLVYALRDRLQWYGELLPLREHLWVLGVIVVLWPTLARSVGLADSQTYFWPRRLFLLTLRVHVIGALALLSSLYLLRAVAVSRLFIQTFLLMSGVALAAERAVIRRIMMRKVALRGYARRTIMIGTTPTAARFQRLLTLRPHWGNEVCGFLLTDDSPVVPTFGRKRVLGHLSDLEMLLDTMVLDDVVLASPLEPAEVDWIAQRCADRGLTFHTLVHMPAPPHARHHAEALGNGLYMMSLERTPQSLNPLLVKRAFDIVAGAVGMVICGLVYIVSAPVILFSSPGPVIFKQTRVGLNGRLFTMYKLRTMRPDAEARKAVLAAANEMRGHVFKMGSDPRVTGIGRLLRRFYLDELPQFWNVLKGEMSLVGPRPPLPQEVAQYAPYHRRRLSVRPGITGPWQVKGNGAVADFEEVVRLECEYIDQWSLWSDVQVLWQTCATITRMAGQ